QVQVVAPGRAEEDRVVTAREIRFEAGDVRVVHYGEADEGFARCKYDGIGAGRTQDVKIIAPGTAVVTHARVERRAVDVVNDHGVVAFECVEREPAQCRNGKCVTRRQVGRSVDPDVG